MKQGILFTAPIGARNKRETLFKEIVSTHPDNNFSSVLFLGPNNFVLSETKRQFFSYLKKQHNTSAYIPFQSLTIKQVASILHEVSLHAGQEGGDVISEHIRPLVLCEILEANNIGYARILSDLFRKTGHYILNKSLIQIKEEISALIFEEKARDRAVRAIEVLQSYENKLKGENLVDPVDVLRDSIKLQNHGSWVMGHGSNPPSPPLQKGGAIPLPLAPCPLPLNFTLVIDGFFDPTPLETEIIKTLMDKAEKAFVLAEEGSDILESIRAQQPGMEIRQLKRALTREKTGCYTYPSMEDEVEGIARNVKKLLLEGMKPWEITVSFPVLSKYLPMVRRIFKKHGVPVNIGEYDLSASRPLTALGELLNCIAEDYPRNAFLSFLTSPCFPLVPNVLRERAVNYSYRAGIIKGKQSWLSIEGSMQNRNDEKASEAEKKRLNDFQKEINRIISTIENIKQKKALLPFLDEFETALSQWGFFDYLKNPGENLPGDDTADRLISRFSELRHFAGLYPDGLRADGAPEFYLRYLLQDIKGFDESSDGVKIIPYELAAVTETEAFFFGGVIEGDFPSRPDIDPILPEKVKKALGMPYLEYYMNRQKMYFNRLLHISRHEPVFSCPTAEGDKIFLPSPFLDWENMPGPVELDIFTDEEVLIREGSAQKLDGCSHAETYFDHNSTAILRSLIGGMSKRYFRVTDLDYYRKCPFRFYLDKILGLEMETPPRFEVEYRQWGTLAHRTMEHLFKDKDWEMDDFEARLFEALEKSLREIPIAEFWADVTREIFRNLLPLLRKQEAEIRMKGYSPWLAEEKIEAEIDGVKLKGKIDRIDKKKSQELRVTSHEKITLNSELLTLNSVILLDYKTGEIDKKSLQLPLYARMWQMTHPQQVDEAGYYSLKDGKVTSYPPKKKSMEEFIQEALQETAALIGQMKKGMFPAEPVNSACRNCGHDALCGKG
ncbi:MAG: PD-(D/E)XK nuclease family protein [Nitrospirae bacterium]|nr:PD-(D/E)XK nuclease family protein [Nitrospirota bacterium]